MDRGRNLEALAEENDEEEMEEHKKDSDSDSSTSDDDDAPDEGTKRGEPNKFDILCDGVKNAMALVHTALEELLEMKDEMLKHKLPPSLLIKLATNTGKVFRSISDLNMPVNELVRLVGVYSTPWEEKSAALKKLHEDYEVKQRQLHIAIKRLQLVDAHSKRIAREKRIMNWEKLFAKVMSNKGHGRRWKFLIETIKQKAKLGLEHVQEFTRQLDESDEEEEEEEDDMPTLQLKHGGESPSSTSDKVSEGDTEAEDEEVAGEGEVAGKDGEGSEVGAEQGEVKGEVPSIKIEQAEEDGSDDDDEEEEDVEEAQEETISAETSKRVRFAEAQRLPPLKVETKDVEVWTQEPEYEHYMCVRMYAPVGMKQMDLKCSVAFGKHFYKSKRLDENTGTPLPANTPTSQIKKNRYEEAMFSLPQETLPGIWQGKKPVGQELPKNCQITVHSGPTDSIAAMATIDMADLKELDLKTITLPPPHGDDEVPRTPEPPGDDDLDSLSDDMEIPLPGDERKGSEKSGAMEDRIKDVDPMMFPLYSLDGSSTKHSPCGSLPLIFYWARRPKPHTFNRQIGTHGVTELVFELTGIDLETTSKDDLNKETHDKCTSVMSYRREVTDRALSAHRFTPEVEPSNPPASPEHEYIPEVIVTENMELEKKEEPKEELIAKAEYDKVVEKHNNDLVYLQEEYEKRLQVLMDNLQLMEKNQRQHQQQMMKQQQQLEEQQKLLSQRNITSPGLSPQATFAPPGTPTKKSDEVHRPVVHAPMPPQKARPRQQKKRPAVVQRTWDGVPSEFLERLAYFEDESYRHKLELIEKTRREIQEDIEKKLAGQHKLSRQDREMYEALNDVSLPALFMPFQRGSVFNPRAHQYFHPTGSTDIRLTQPPSMFQLPPLHKNSSSILNLFELSKNFNSRGQGWLMDRYIQQQEPLKNPHGMMPQTTMPTSMMRSPTFTPQPTFDLPSTRDEPRQREAEAEC